MADEEHWLILVLREPGHDRVVVGETAIAVNLDKAGEQAVDEILEPGPIRMPRHLHPLPRRERSVQLGAHRFDPPVPHLDLAVARVGMRQERQRVDLF